MLSAPAADIRSVLYRTLGLVGFVCCALVVVSFALFADDQIAGASQHQQQELATNGPTTVAAPSSKPHAQPRRFIDGAAKTLTSPFTSFVHSSSAWLNHGVPAVLALAGYGLGLGFIRRYTRGLP
jgi:hypothetical protein